MKFGRSAISQNSPKDSLGTVERVFEGRGVYVPFSKECALSNGFAYQTHVPLGQFSILF